MRASIILASVFVAGVLSIPVFETKNVYVWKTVVITEGSLPTPTPEPVVQPAEEAPKNYNWFNGRRRHSYSSVSEPASVTPQSTSTSSSKAPPPPPPSSTPPPPPPPSSTPPPPPPPPPPSSTPPPPPPATPTPKAPAAPASDGSPLSDGVSLLTTANKWRSIYSLPKFVWDSQLEKNALKTGVDGGGVNQVHQLGPGSYGQVITPGMRTAYGDLGGDTPFELSYVAWLCEVSSDPQLKTGGVDQCALVETNLHMTYSSTGHYDILTNKAYTKIGCAFAVNPNAGTNTPYQGLWVCDLGY